MFNDIYNNRRVLITGHTGFKGSWLAHWLSKLGATLFGYSLAPPTEPNHISLLSPDLEHAEADIRDLGAVKDAFSAFAPDAVFHLAAQSLVRPSYRDPVDTFATNVMGTVNLLEAARSCPSVRAFVNVTSDKCYENREWVWGYRESDPMGGHDPYSCSKGCSELVTAAYRNSFFSRTGDLRLASCRAGNVIGGGDWADDRLVPDLIKTAARGEITRIRNPRATRPWQHVLEPLSGYLRVGQKLLMGEAFAADGWNFGPDEEASITVEAVAEKMANCWDAVQYEINPEAGAPHEATLLKLDCSKARCRLDWRPVWDSSRAVERTAEWYKAYYERGDIRTADDLDTYVEAAIAKGCSWAL